MSHENKKTLSPFYYKKTFLIENECETLGILHSFSIKNIFSDKMDLRLFHVHVTKWELSDLLANDQKKKKIVTSAPELLSHGSGVGAYNIENCIGIFKKQPTRRTDNLQANDLHELYLGRSSNYLIPLRFSEYSRFEISESCTGVTEMWRNLRKCFEWLQLQ